MSADTLPKSASVVGSAGGGARGSVAGQPAQTPQPGGSSVRRSAIESEPRVRECLPAVSWPGNVRELDHTIERGVLMARGGRTSVPDLGLIPSRSASQNLDDLSLEAVEAILIRKALARSQGNVSHAAEALELSRGALYHRMEKDGF